MSEKVVGIGTEKALTQQAWEETVATLQKGYDQLKEKHDRLDEEAAYLRFFHFAVTAGIVCGLDHPIEWAINAYRTPGATLSPEYYQDARKQLPRFLREMFSDLNMKDPESADEVLAWCDEHYPEGHLAKGFFGFLREGIDGHLEEERRKG